MIQFFSTRCWQIRLFGVSFEECLGALVVPETVVGNYWSRSQRERVFKVFKFEWSISKLTKNLNGISLQCSFSKLPMKKWVSLLSKEFCKYFTDLLIRIWGYMSYKNGRFHSILAFTCSPNFYYSTVSFRWAL